MVKFKNMIDDIVIEDYDLNLPYKAYMASLIFYILLY